MKRRFLCLCAALCLLFASCGAQTAESASSSAGNLSGDPADALSGDRMESDTASSLGDIQIPAEATALLDMLFGEEQSFTAAWDGGPVEWIGSGRVAEVRSRVNAIGTPFLTEETVLQIARRVAAFYLSAAEAGCRIDLPGCDGISAVRLPGAADGEAADYEWEYDVLLAYTLYLLTPPRYVFSQLEAGELSAGAWSFDLYLLPAGHYGDRLDALGSLRRDKRAFVLHLEPSVRDEKNVDFSLVAASCTLLAGEETQTPDLSGMGDNVDGFLRQMQLRERLDFHLQTLLSGYTATRYIGYLDDGRSACSFLDDERAAFLRETADSLSAPFLTVEKASALIRYLSRQMDSTTAVRLSDADGTGEVLLDPLALGREAVLAGTVAYFIDLFTPRAYRFAGETALPEGEGTVYMLRGSYRTPEEALASLRTRDAAFVKATENAYGLYDRR